MCDKNPVINERNVQPLLTREITDSSLVLNVPEIISVSGKGGIGKTNVLINLAVAFAQLHKKVFVLDGNLGMPDIHTLLGLTPKYGIKHFIEEREIPSNCLIKGPSGITILPGPFEEPGMNLTELEKISLIEKLELMATKTDIILIDNESGISKNVLFFNMLAMKNIIIITSEPTSLVNAHVLIKKLFSRKKKKFAILVNYVQNKSHAIKIYKDFVRTLDRCLGSLLSVEFLGYLPFDQKIKEAVGYQRAVLEMWPEAASSSSFVTLAEGIVENSPGKGRARGRIIDDLDTLCKQSRN